MNSIKSIISILLFSLVLFSCKKDPVTSTQNTPPKGTTWKTGVLILNEGLFSQGTSTLSVFDSAKDKIYNDIFFDANKRHLGDVGNDIKIKNHRAYIVVNNSNKIEIVADTSGKSIGTISLSQGVSPREIVFVNDSIALVSNLYDSSVSELNVFQRTELQRIVVGANPDGIAIIGEKAFVANSGNGEGSTVSVINTGSMTVINTIVVGDNPVSVAVDKDGEVYVLCAGFYNDFSNPNDDTPAKIKILNATSEQITDSIYVGGHSFSMAIGAVIERGYVCADTSVISINTATNSAVGNFVNKNVYSVGIDEVTGDVYIGDAKDFQTNGSVSIYSSSGTLRKAFDVGIIPTAFAFVR